MNEFEKQELFRQDGMDGSVWPKETKVMELKMMDIQRVCDQCDGGKVMKSWKVEHVPVRLSDSALITITPTVPVWTCQDCGEAYTDYEAEPIRDCAARAVQTAYALGKGDLPTVLELTKQST